MKQLFLGYIFVCVLAFNIGSSSFCADGQALTTDEKVFQAINFDGVKDVLKKDKLEQEVQTTKTVIAKKIDKAVEDNRNKYQIPDIEFWSFFSELWLIKNAQILQWDISSPDYGIELSFKQFLEKFGYYEKPFKILLVNSPNIFHIALPTNGESAILLLSLPFLKALDLSKLEISLLLFEDFIREEFSFFKNYVESNELKALLGTNFLGKDFNKDLFNKHLDKYDQLLFDKGFSFQQQFEVTNKVGAVLKSDMKYWDAYFALIKKIDLIVKENPQYSRYNKIFPSPEFQLGWLKPEKDKKD